jgi:hypothetical protein
VVAGDGHRVGGGASALRRGATGAAGLTDLSNLNAVMAFRVDNTVSQLVQSLTEGVVVA